MASKFFRRFCGTALAFWGLLAAAQAGAFLSGVTVTISNPLVSQATNFTIVGNVLQNAVLIGDSLAVVFPAGTDVSGLTAADIRVNGVAVGGGLSVGGGTVIISSPVSVGAGQPLVIQFDNLHIINPSTAGPTSLTLSTPYESGIGPYTLTNPPPSFTDTPTRTSTATPTRSVTPSSTVSPTPTITPTPTISPTATVTQTRTITVSPTISPTITLTATPLSSQTTTQTVTLTPVVLAKNTLISYPSPARGKEVWFYFNADQAGRLEIEFYNVSGEKIASLGEEVSQAGYGHFRWELGQVSPGVYLYRARFLDRDGKGAWGSLRKMAVVK